MNKMSGSVSQIFAGAGGYFGSKIATGVTSGLVKSVSNSLIGDLLKIATPLAISFAVIGYAPDSWDKYSTAIAVGAAIPAVENFLDILSKMTGPAQIAPGGYDQPSKMGSRVHAEDGLSGHDMMSNDNSENEDDLYQGIFSTSEP